MSVTTASVPDHPAISYMNMRGELNEWYSTDDVPVRRHALSYALSALSCFEECSEQDSDLLDIKLIGNQDNADLGTIQAVDLDGIRALASPSSFGKDTETVYDEAVRKGFEVPAEKLGFALDRKVRKQHWREQRRETAKDVFNSIATSIGRELFPGRPIKLVFYKLAMYEQDGHFARHRDSTHGDAHHGTLLIGCAASDESLQYQGGKFTLHFGDGSAKQYEIHPATWVAFYTDVEHSVAPVTSGVRLTLQFDVFLEDETHIRPHTVACVRPSYIGMKLPNFDDKYHAEDDVGGNAGGEKTKGLSPGNTKNAGAIRDSGRGKDSEAQDNDNEDKDEAHDRGNPDEGKDENEGEDERENTEEDDDEDDDEYDEYDDEDEDDDTGEEGLLINPEARHQAGRSTRGADAQLNQFVSKLTKLIRRVEVRGDTHPTNKLPSQASPKNARPRTVAFLLHHMYRQQSLLPEYLKGIDRALYFALVGAEPTLKIQIHPVYIRVENLMNDYEPQPWQQNWKIAKEDCAAIQDSIPSPVVFIQRRGIEFGLLEHQEGAEYTGNEALSAEYKYFAGAMFVYFP